MGGVNRTSNAPDFRGGDMMAFMGGCEIDLRQARIAAGPAVIDAFAFWGGVEIQVPEVASAPAMTCAIGIRGVYH